ncbi:MAG: hypothetical protein U0K15_03880 [Dialister sp.]|nr:hypothetical protein [Dialister sp.]
MRDEELLVRKKKLATLLVHRMNRHFYPLACRSFSHEALSIDQAFAWEADALSAKERSKVLKKYVHFRLALAKMFLTTEAKSSPFLSLTLTEKLSLDVTGQFSKAFERVHDGLSYFFSSTGKPEAGILPLVSLLSLETGLSLSPYVDFFRKETLSYIDRMQRDGTDFLAALSFCDPEYHAGDTRLPAFLCLALGEAEGRALAAQVFESAQMLGTLEQCLSPLYPLKDAARARFLYAYVRFRAHVFSFFVSYLRQERAMRPAILRGALTSPCFARWVHRMQMQGFLSDRDQEESQRFYLKVNMFLRQWVIFDPKQPRYYYHYFPDFTHSITARTEAEDFDARVTVLLQEILRITGADPLPPDAMGFLVQETKTYLVNMAHTVYFSYSLGLRRPEDFVAARYRRKEGSSLLHQIKRALGLKG